MARSDTDRIDWLCENASLLGIKPDWAWVSSSGEDGEHTDIREKIDKLMGDE